MAVLKNRERTLKDYIESLIGICHLEINTGYIDRSVFGGMDRLLSQWSLREEIYPLFEKFKSNNLYPLNYSELEQKKRIIWIKKILQILVAINPLMTNEFINTFDREITYFKSITNTLAVKLNKLNIHKLRDLLYHFPRRYSRINTVDKLMPGEDATIVVRCDSTQVVFLGSKRNFKATEAIFSDKSGSIKVIWYNQTYLKRQLAIGKLYILSGKTNVHNGYKTLESPDWELTDFEMSKQKFLSFGRLFPVYGKTEGVSQSRLRKVIRDFLREFVSEVEEYLPESLLLDNGLLRLRDAIIQMHYPSSGLSLAQSRKRLAFDELFLLQMSFLYYRSDIERHINSIKITNISQSQKEFLNILPFELTEGQKKVFKEIIDDLSNSRKPMRRLLQGDVGSGKTVVALGSLLSVVGSGYQGVLMAPTEVLAEQHYLTIRKLLSHDIADTSSFFEVTRLKSDRNFRIGILTGSMSKKNKDNIHKMLGSGQLDIVIGTHSVIQENVVIPNLALAVVDEEHRFGVDQRNALFGKNLYAKTIPHMLAMTATPIPASLAMAIYGDLESSIIDTLPLGRKQIRTRVVDKINRNKMYEFVDKQIDQGRQAFVVYPLIDESESINAKAAIVEQSRLQNEIFPNRNVGLLHGRMKMDEKQQVMEKFRMGTIDLLVSTPVIEVGVDVPNASVMIIEGADRFGIAQLHQFRGRVGRGEHESYCMLVAEDPSNDSIERLKAVEKISDGFKLAEIDLESRGEGNVRQHGKVQSGHDFLKIADIKTDFKLMQIARFEAKKIINKDPSLESEENLGIAEALLNS
jgi:ATP-dependent DNA helicase RecG